MKIVFYSSPSFCDCDFPLIREFQRMGHEVYYFIRMLEYAKQSTVIDIPKIVPINDIIPFSNYPELNRFQSYMDLSKCFVVNQINKHEYSFSTIHLYSGKFYCQVKKISPDIILCAGFVNLAALRLLRFSKKIHMIIHDPLPHSGASAKLRVGPINTKFVKHYYLLNDNQKDAFLNRWNLSDDCVSINRLGIYDPVRLFADKNLINKAHNKYILFFGRIAEYKGLEFLCEAMNIVHSKISDVSLIIAGSGKLYFDFAQYEGKEYINIINRYITTPELATLLENCLFTVCPYIDATQSGVIMTSYTFCKPVIATNVGGLSTMVIDNKTGLIIPPRDVKALADSIINLLQNESLRKSMTDEIKYLTENGAYSWHSIAQRYVDSFEKSMNS